MNKLYTAAAYIVIIVTLLVLLAIGYMLNLHTLFNSQLNCDMRYVLRVVGVFVPPFGGIMGYL